MLQISNHQNGSEVEATLGECFEVQLGENPTTGYRWQMSLQPHPVLQIQEETFQRSGGRIGAGGFRCWRLRAAQVGTTRLEMEYRRPWEKQAVETFRVTVRVKAPEVANPQ